MNGIESKDSPAIKRVEPFPDLMWAWNGFWRLSNARPVGFDGVLRIPLSEIEAYARMQEFDFAKRVEFLRYIEGMDHVFMKYVERQRELQALKDKNTSKEKGRGRRRR